MHICGKFAAVQRTSLEPSSADSVVHIRKLCIFNHDEPLVLLASPEPSAPLALKEVAQHSLQIFCTVLDEPLRFLLRF